MPEFVRAAEVELAAERELAAAPVCTQETFRELAHAWLEYIADVEDAKPATLRDYRAMLAEPRSSRSNNYVFGNAAGDRIDGPALRRRYIGARDRLTRYAESSRASNARRRARRALPPGLNGRRSWLACVG